MTFIAIIIFAAVGALIGGMIADERAFRQWRSVYYADAPQARPVLIW